MRIDRIAAIATAAALTFGAGSASAEAVFSPYAGNTRPTRVYWGDEHIHTGWSADAGGFGCTLSPEDALRFARGEEVKSSLGLPAKLSRPLDWGVVTDHSDGAGVIFEIRDGNPELMKNPTLKKWHDMMQAGKGLEAASELIVAQSTKTLPEEVKDPKLAATVWRKNTTIMEKYDEPGRFTAFIGYEWTSNAGGGDNLHRNVIYRDGKDLADQVSPMTTFDSENPEDLWKWMAAYEKKTGGRLLAIPHNGNLSNGRMFALTTFLGNPPTREWAETRAKWEPVYEITQIKGDGETQPTLSPNDEFAGFERWDQGNLVGVPKKPGMLEREYARRALGDGLALEQTLGVNPFKYGFVGGTDTHTGLATAEEDNFFGKHTGVEPAEHRWEHTVIKSEFGEMKGWQMSASGWTGVWATENTREAIWDALQRKEAYATTGSRITVRFFGGWHFDAGGRRVAVARGRRLPEGRADGRRPRGRAAGQGAELPGRRDEGSHRRESRSHPGGQGLAREGRQRRREGLRRRVERSGPAQAGAGRQDPAGGQHGRREERDLDQHDRGFRTDHGLEGPGLRSGAEGGLLRARARDPDAALDRVRCQTLRHHDVARGPDDPPGARLHVADLVHAGDVDAAAIGSGPSGH